MDKEYILRDIKRTAALNGGVPLGRARFSRETGIKQYEWYGQFWARWSEAVIEAGLTPNKLTVAIAEDLLIEKLVALARELGRLPVEGDLLIKARNEKGFPNHSTFARLGPLRQRVARILEYCGTREDFADIVALCAAVPPISSESDRVVGREQTLGFVYLIKFGKHYKIGRSNAAGRRERELAIQLPEKSRTVHIIRTDDPMGIEAYWHKRFENKRKNGEWFELTSVDVKAFTRRKFM